MREREDTLVADVRRWIVSLRQGATAASDANVHEYMLRMDVRWRGGAALAADKGKDAVRLRRPWGGVLLAREHP